MWWVSIVIEFPLLNIFRNRIGEARLNKIRVPTPRSLLGESGLGILHFF